MPIRIRNITPKFTGKVRIGVTQLSPEFLSSTMLTTVHETMPVDATVLVNQPDVTFSAVGVLPSGFSINPGTGRVSAARTAVVPAEGTTMDVGVRATNAKGLSTQKTFQVRVEGSAEGDLYDFPVGHTLDPTYLPVTSELLAVQYPRLAAKFGVRNKTANSLAGVDYTSAYQPSTTASNHRYGGSFSLSGDASWLLVAAPGDSTTASQSGSVYLTQRSSSTASLFSGVSIRLRAPTPTSGGLFGSSVAVSHDSTRIAVGASGEGKVYTYTKSNTTMSAATTLTRNNGTAFSANFGYSVVMSGDGTYLVVAYANTNSLEGFTYDTSAGKWIHTNTFSNNNPIGYNSTEARKASISLNYDATVLVVGDTSGPGYVNPTSGSVSNNGRLIVWKRANNVWGNPTYIGNPSNYANDGFGYTVAVSGDGSTIVATATSTLHMEVFKNVNSNWILQKNTNNLNSVDSYRVNDVSINQDGSIVSFVQGTVGTGQIYISVYANDAWPVPTKLTGDGAVANGYVGESGVSMDTSGTFVVAASVRNSTNRGILHVWKPRYNVASSSLINLPSNTVGKLTAVKIRLNRVPTWNTPAGSLGSFVKTTPVSVQLNAVDPDGAVQYSLISGSLPAGVTLSPTGLISGTSTITADTTASFTVRATGDAADSVDRAFTLTVTVPSLAATELFAASIYDGTDSLNAVDSVDFTAGGLLWIKNRTTGIGHMLFDTNRGENNFLRSNETSASSSIAALNQKFTNKGFSFNTAQYNAVGTPGQKFSAWSFRKAPKFFDVVAYTGNGAAGRQVPHALSVTPGMIMVKAVGFESHWIVYHRSRSASGGFRMITSGYADYTGWWNGTAPTSSVFTVGNDGSVNESGQQYVAYVFAHDVSTTGAIQCGSYSSNGSDLTVQLGWQPRFLLVKPNASSGGNVSGSWYMFDTTLVAGTSDKYLLAESNSAEANPGADLINLVGTGSTAGFGVRSGTVISANGVSYVYMAIR